MSVDKLAELYEVVKQDWEISHWSKKQTLSSRLKELDLEVKELLHEVESKNTEKIKDELGDVLLDILALLVIAENNNIFSTQETVDNLICKLKRRKPFIFTKEIQKDADHEVKIWMDAKAKEK